jgi:hypothetical protein
MLHRPDTGSERGDALVRGTDTERVGACGTPLPASQPDRDTVGNAIPATERGTDPDTDPNADGSADPDTRTHT